MMNPNTKNNPELQAKLEIGEQFQKDLALKLKIPHQEISGRWNTSPRGSDLPVFYSIDFYIPTKAYAEVKYTGYMDPTDLSWEIQRRKALVQSMVYNVLIQDCSKECASMYYSRFYLKANPHLDQTLFYVEKEIPYFLIFGEHYYKIRKPSLHIIDEVKSLLMRKILAITGDYGDAYQWKAEQEEDWFNALLTAVSYEEIQKDQFIQILNS